MRSVQFGFVAVILAAALGLAGCGAAPSNPRPNNPPASPPPAGNSGPTFTAGVFQPASTFKDRCQVVRTGVDFEGNRFPDRPGSTVEENFWLRSWTRETYLFNTEVVDRNPASFANRLDYFAVLRTTATTPSGRDKDEFHFSQPTDEFLRQRNSAPRSGYGARIVAFRTTRPRDYRILYTEANSPASTIVGGVANFVRGARLLEIDGVDVVNGGVNQTELDILNNGLFPATAGETHIFRLQDPGAAPRTVTITSANIAPKPVNRLSIIDTPSGRVGYILFNTFSPFASERDIAEAINAVRAAGVNDLVLDLRYNGGGLLAVAAQLGYMIAGPAQTNGRTFELLRFNAAAGNRNPVTGEINQPTPFFSTGLGFSLANGAPLQSLNLPRVFILSTDNTCSASESVINALRGIFVDVVLIGGTTCGKPFGFYPTDNCGETYFTTQFQGVNNVNFGDYADGFIPQNSSASFGVRIPGCVVADDFDHELGDEAEALLATALFYRSAGVCPSGAVSQARTSSVAAEAFVDLAPEIYVPLNDHDLTLPD